MSTNIKSKNRLKNKKRNTPRNRAAVKESIENNSSLVYILKGFSVGATSFLILLSAFALVMVKYDFDNTVITVFAIVSCCLSAFVSGFWTARRAGKKGLITGLTASIPTLIFILILILIVSKGSLGLIALITGILILLFGSLGGIAAVNTHRKRKIK